MAKATFSCAHCGASVAVIGRNRSDADRLAQYREQSGALCHECWAKEQVEKRAAASQQAAETAAAIGLPVLQGTEKQVSWAESIRQGCLAKLAKIEAFAASSIQEGHDDMVVVVNLAFDAIKAQDSAHWWIENRDAEFFITTSDFIIWLLGGIEYCKLPEDQLAARARHHFGGLPKPATESAPTPIIADAKSEATVRPVAPKTETVAEITAYADRVEVRFPEKRRDFWDIIKPQLGYAWESDRWVRKTGSLTGTPEDRAVEVGNALLNAGFIIRIYDPELRRRAIAGDFIPENHRWIAYHSNTHFAVRWGKDDDFYDAARRLPRSKYEKPCVTVPVEFFEEVEDFASRYGFEFSTAGRQLADQARASRLAALVAAPEPAKNSPPTKIGKVKPPKLEIVEGEIDADLLEDN